MNRSVTALLFLCVVGPTACASAKRAAAPHVHYTAAHQAVVSIWVQDHPRLPPDLILEGCMLWSVKGVHCELVFNRAGADLQVVVNELHCPTNKDGSTTLAVTSRRGLITVNTSCFYGESDESDETSSFDSPYFRAALGHEVGHGIGVWDHIPEECHGAETVCGEALMNTYLTTSLTNILPPDALALDQHLDLSIHPRDLVPETDEAEDDEIVETLTSRP